jgi:hypothetical protein
MGRLALKNLSLACGMYIFYNLLYECQVLEDKASNTVNTH